MYRVVQRELQLTEFQVQEVVAGLCDIWVIQRARLARWHIATAPVKAEERL